MAVKDDLQKTSKAGVYYREHPSRKNGVKKDRQWVVIQKLGGKRRVSTLGWWKLDGISEGDALNIADGYKANYKWNAENPEQPPRPLCKKEEDAIAADKAKAIEKQRVLERKENMTIAQMWEQVYLPIAEQNKKPRTIGSEKALYEKWIEGSLGSKRLVDLTQLDYTRLTKKILSKGRSPRTVHYVFSIILQIWSTAFDQSLVNVQPPRRKTLKLPDIDNARDRAFTTEEAKAFLAAMQEKSLQWHDISLLSLLTGMRASEIYKLKKQDIDLQRNLLFLRSPKKSKSQYLQISDAAKQHLTEMLKQCEPEQELLVVNRKGEQIKEVSDTVQRVIDGLGFNNEVEAKERLTFHSLRHTTATWLLEQGEDIYRVSKLLRHSTVRMTEQRYAHLSNDTMKKTADKIGGLLDSEEIESLEDKEIANQ